MKSFYFILLFHFIMFSGACYCQHSFRPGYIITLNNDTVHGLVKMKTYVKNCKACTFKKDKKTKRTIYSPNDIKAYRFDNAEFYVSKTISINDEKRKVFLQYLVNGIAKLYYYKILGNDFYFIQKDSLFQILTREERIIGDSLQTIERYKKILKYILKDDSTIAPQIENAHLNHKPLIELTKRYHYDVCKDKNCIEYSLSTNPDYYFSPTLGISNTQDFLSKSKNDKSSNLNYVFGLLFRTSMLNVNKKWNFVLGLLYAPNNFDYFKTNDNNYYYNSSWSLPYGGTYYVKISYQSLKIPLILQYYFTLRKLKPYFLAGISNVFLLKKNSDVYFDYNPFNLSGPFNHYEISSGLSDYELGYILGGGLAYNFNKKVNLQLQVEYENREQTKIGNNYKVLDYLRFNSFNLNFGIEYKF